MVKDLFLKNGEFTVQPVSGAKAVPTHLPKHYTIAWNGCGRRVLRDGHGEEVQLLTGNDYGRPVPEIIENTYEGRYRGERTTLSIAA